MDLNWVVDDRSGECLAEAAVGPGPHCVHACLSVASSKTSFWGGVTRRKFDEAESEPIQLQLAYGMEAGCFASSVT